MASTRNGEPGMSTKEQAATREEASRRQPLSLGDYLASQASSCACFSAMMSSTPAFFRS